LPLNDHYRNVTRHAQVIFVPTAFVKQELVRWFECDDQKIVVTGEGAKETFKPLKAIPDKLNGYGIGKNDRFFLYVGRLDKRKNIPRLLESFKNLCSQTSASLKLVMVSGGSQKRIEELKSEISTKGLTGDVIHLQNLNDVDLAILYNAALALVLVSLSEGFGLPVVEAMQCGTPVITSNTTSLAEVGGDAAITVNPEDTKEISHAMSRLLQDSALRENHRNKGFQQAKQYSWEKTARLTLTGYEKALSNA
jgi:glycosyltransferase involved in cell wall biosynthesis